MNDDKIYDALARVMVSPRIDDYGNKLTNPLVEAMNEWARNKDSITKLVDLIAKDINMEDLVKAVADKLKGEFVGWYNKTRKEDVKDMALKMVAEKLAEKELEKLKEK